MLELLIFILGIMSGYIIREIIFLRDILRTQKKMRILLNNAQHKNARVNSSETSENSEHWNNIDVVVYKLNYETYNGVYYFYESETNNFVCQGSTFEECAINFSKVRGQEAMGLFKNNNTKKFEYFRNGNHSNVTIVE